MLLIYGYLSGPKYPPVFHASNFIPEWCFRRCWYWIAIGELLSFSAMTGSGRFSHLPILLKYILVFTITLFIIILSVYAILLGVFPISHNISASAPIHLPPSSLKGRAIPPMPPVCDRPASRKNFTWEIMNMGQDDDWRSDQVKINQISVGPDEHPCQVWDIFLQQLKNDTAILVLVNMVMSLRG